jgi:hypothetical protein
MGKGMALASSLVFLHYASNDLRPSMMRVVNAMHEAMSCGIKRTHSCERRSYRGAFVGGVAACENEHIEWR